MKESLRGALAGELGLAVESIEPVAGGDLNDGYRAELADGRAVFVKTRDGAEGDEYLAEAAALRWLAVPGGVRAPAVVGVGEGLPFLALEWIEAGSLDLAGAEELGRGLAATHRAGAAAFGARPEGAVRSRFHIGPLSFADRELDDWPRFYAEQRLDPVASIAYERGSLDAGGRDAVERVCERIDGLAGPAEPSARLHGDLWSGNLLADSEGRAILIDPASYGGHREVDLAMLRLFGTPSDRIFAAYEEAWPLAPGADQRVALYQLFPLLVHAALFGAGWGARAARLGARIAAW